MIWIFGIGLFIVFWFVFPPFRKFVLWVGVILVLLISAVFLYTKHEKTVEESLIPFSKVELTDLKLVNGKLLGEEKNNSDHDLLDVHLEVKAWDCPSPQLPPGVINLGSLCTTIGQDSVYLWNMVPPHQKRAIDSHVFFSNLPSIKGEFRWSYEIVGTRGR